MLLRAVAFRMIAMKAAIPFEPKIVQTTKEAEGAK
jgi:hypothetical protein